MAGGEDGEGSLAAEVKVADLGSVLFVPLDSGRYETHRGDFVPLTLCFEVIGEKRNLLLLYNK